MKAGGKRRTHNRLWATRKRRGLGQKQVAYLLGHTTITQVSRFEKGLRLPNLEAALMLEIVYGTPLRVLFKELYEQLQEEIKQRIEESPRLKQSYSVLSLDEDGNTDYCAYGELLRLPDASLAERKKVRDHVTYLAKKLAHL